MLGNRGMTTLKRKRRRSDPMREYDNLQPELRLWLAAAILPWRPRSVRRTFDKVMARTRDTTCALEELDRLQARLIAKDARKLWGPHHPCAAPTVARKVTCGNATDTEQRAEKWKHSNEGRPAYRECNTALEMTA